MTTMLALCLAVLLFLGSVAPGAALPSAAPGDVGLSSERLDRIAQLVKRQIAEGRYPGAVVIVARKGRVAYYESFGQLDATAGTPMPKDAIFRLYSMTKPFTSVASVMLMEEGRLRLNDPVGRYLPQLAKQEVLVTSTDTTGMATHKMVPPTRPASVYDLLRHASGLVYGAFTPNAHLKDLYTKANATWNGLTPQQQLENFAKVPLAHQPGTAWEYSLSTDILGRVVEVVASARLGQFLDERLFRPLAMKDTTFHVSADKTVRLAQPFATDRVTGQPIRLLDVTKAPLNDAGGAGAAGTAMDYARFAQMLLNGGELEGKRLLGRATVRHMTTDHIGDMKVAVPILQPGYGFGLGFAVRRADGMHGAPGSAGEFNWGGAGGTIFWVDPKEQLVAVWMAQAQPGSGQREFREAFRQAVYQAIVE